MRLIPVIQDSVVFIGWEASAEQGGMTPMGTAFLFEFEGFGYLVTAQHVAVELGDNPFSLRFNRKRGGSHIFRVDPLVHDIKWWTHPNPNVDIAVLPFHFDLEEHGLKYVYVPSSDVAREDNVPMDYGVGDPCYAVGLFRLLTGTKENLAVVHTGHLALCAGRENIPVTDWLDGPRSTKTRNIRAHLVGLHSLDGLSGSPVFVRPPMALENFKVGNTRAFASQERVKLLGIWQGSWRGESLAVASEAAEIDAVIGKARPSFGMGVVTPIGYLMEILEHEDVKKQRDEIRSRASAATPDSVDRTEGEVAAKPDNPSHKEDFRSLLNAAAAANKPAS